MARRSPHPYVAFREGRPRFVPGPELRQKGYNGTDLRWPLVPPERWSITSLKPGDRNEGRWYSMGEAVDWSAAFVKGLAKAKPLTVVKKPELGKPAPRRVAGGKLYTVGDLLEEWFRSAKFQMLADPVERRRQQAAGNIYSDNTARDYRIKAGVLEKHDPDLWAAPVDALTQPIMFGLYEELVASHGIAMARGAIATFSIALKWGRKRGKFTFRENHGVNPAADLGMATPPPRLRFGTRREIETLIAVADHLGWHELGDSTMLGVWTGQRQADRLELHDRGLTNGRRVFRQAKTGAVVAILGAPELERRLAASAERRRAAKAEALLQAAPGEREAIERRFSRVILNEQPHHRTGERLWQPFKREFYSDRFGMLRSYAVAGVLDVAATAAAAEIWKREQRNTPAPAVWIVPPCPSLADFRDQDLRDTAVTWLALAGATIPEIISVTGHSAASATTILKHYLAQHPEMADAAIGKMVAWFDAGGETEIGL